MLLVGDIGGTKTRFALFELQGGKFVRGPVQQYVSASAATFEELAKQFLAAHPCKPEAACFGIPGPVQLGVVKATNLPWTLSEEQLRKNLSIPKVLLVNDLTAFSAAIPALDEDSIVTLHPGSPSREISLSCVLAPGTGLGVGFLHMVNGVPHPISSEGGHANFAPSNDVEIELLRFLRTEYPISVSVERLLCGPGLLNIYRFLKETAYAPESPEVAIRMRSETPATVISSLGMAKTDPLCVRTLELFVSILGSHASNLVLTFLATGGVYLGGGIPPKIIEKLRDGQILEAYFQKQRLREVVEKTPLHVIKDDHAALLGAASLASRL